MIDHAVDGTSALWGRQYRKQLLAILHNREQARSYNIAIRSTPVRGSLPL